MKLHTSESCRVVIFLGAPGSGKGTQAKKLSAQTGLPHISTGDLFREHIQQNTSLGKRAKEFINRGELVPDTLVLEMLFERVSREDCSSGLILDGFPRTIVQAEALDNFLSTRYQSVVFNLQVTEASLMQRLCGRLCCSSCGHLYNSYLLPPKKEGICDLCEGSLYQREDDREEVVLERQRNYSLQTAPLIQYYESKGLLQQLNGEMDAGSIFEQIVRVLNL